MPWLNRIKKLKKFDLYLASAMLIIALVWFLIVNTYTGRGEYVSVYKDNSVIARYALNEDGTYFISETGVYSSENDLDTIGNISFEFEINNGNVDVLFSTCPDKLCMHQKAINSNSETIVCLPNKIVLEINSGHSSNKNKDTLDAVTK